MPDPDPSGFTPLNRYTSFARAPGFHRDTPIVYTQVLETPLEAHPACHDWGPLTEAKERNSDE